MREKIIVRTDTVETDDLLIENLERIINQPDIRVTSWEELQDYLNKDVVLSLARAIKALQTKVRSEEHPVMVVGDKKYLKDPFTYRGFKASVFDIECDRHKLSISSNLESGLSLNIPFYEEQVDPKGSVYASVKPSVSGGYFIRHGGRILLGEPQAVIEAIQESAPIIVAASKVT